MVQVKKTGLPEPYAFYTETFINEQVPLILDKVLQILQVTGADGVACADFIEEAIGLFIWTFSKKNYKLIPNLSKIFDPTQPFYTYNGRNETSPYSTFLTRFATTFKVRFGPLFMLNTLKSQKLTADEVVSILDVLKKVSVILGRNEVFNKPEQASLAFNTAVSNILMDKAGRDIPHKQVVSIFESIFDCCVDESIIASCIQTIKMFLDTEIVEVQISGIKLCNLLFTQGMSPSRAREPSSIDVLSHSLKKIESLEALQCMKPTLVHLAKGNALSEDIIGVLYHTVISQHASILPQAINIFADVLLSQKGGDASTIFNICENMPYALLGRLLEGPEYTEMAAFMLWSEVGNNPEIFDTFMKAASKVDLTLLLPSITSMAEENKDTTVKCVELCKEILQKATAEYDPSELIDTCIKNGKIDHQTVKNLVSIVSRTRTKFNAQQIERIFAELDDSSACSFFKMLLPERFPCLAAPEAEQTLVSVVRHSGLSRFDILEHCYLDVSYSEAPPQVIHSLVTAADETLWAMAMEDNERVRQLLLSVRETRELPTKLVHLTERAISCLDSHANAALTLAEQCVLTANEQCDPESLGFVKHMYTDKGDEVEITLRVRSETHKITVSKKDTSMSLKPKVSRILDNCAVTSIVLYNNKQCLKPCLISDLQQPIEIEARLLNEFEPPAVFTSDLHPIKSLMSHYDELFKLLVAKDTASHAFDVLMLLPTPQNYSINELHPNEPYEFLYQLNYIAKHQDESKPLLGNIEEVFLNFFDTLLPESRFVLSTLLSQKGSPHLIPALSKLVSLPNNETFSNIAERIILLIEDIDNVELDDGQLSQFLFDERRSFVERMLQTKLIKSQSFERVFRLFSSQSDKIKHCFVITALDPPVEFAERVFSVMAPFFETLDTDVIQCLALLCEKWDAFPVQQIGATLIDGFIRCTRREIKVHSSPFVLLRTMMQRDASFRSAVLTALTESLPKGSQWGYAPSNESRSEQTDRCGLTNLCATCYVNSVVQQLFAIEPFRRFIISTEFEDSGLKALRRVFTQLEFSSSKAIDMHSFCSEWKDWDGNPINPREQQDAHEFLMYVLTKLEETPGERLFAGKLSTIMRAVGGEDFSNTSEERFTILPLEISGQSNFADSLQLFSAPETITDYRADNIDHPITVERFTTIKELPTFLIVQLKRFEFSIETGMKTKIDSNYKFPAVAEINGEKFDLRGIVIHQGDAEAGHYFSYTKNAESKWICLNDTNASFTEEERVLDTAYGSYEFGTSAYLLFYVKEGADIPQFELRPDAQLLDQIQSENRKLLSDRIYFSSEFAEFMENISHIESCTEVAFRYYLYVLSHSSNENVFQNMSQSIISHITTSKSELDLYLHLLLDDVQVVCDIMTYASPAKVRQSFNSTITELFRAIGPENDLICVILSQVFDWSPLILSMWRKAFDIFLVIESFCAIGPEYIEYVNGYEFADVLIQFVVKDIPAYVLDKQNNVPVDRFRRINDLSHLLNTLVLLGIPSESLSPPFLKWCIESDKNVDALVNFFKHVPKGVDVRQVVIDCKPQSPCEDLILALASKLGLVVPNQWLSQSAEAEGRLGRALQRCDNVMELCRKQPQLIARILFAVSAEARQDAIESVMKRVDETAFDALAPLVKYVPSLSKRTYNEGGGTLQSALPFDSYPAYQFLSLLLQQLPQCADAYKHCPLIAQSLHETYNVGGLYDSHIPLLCQLFCNAARSESAPPDVITAAALQTLRQCVDRFPENMSGRDETVRTFFLLLQKAVSQTKLSGDDIFGDSLRVVPMCLFTNSLPTATKALVSFAEEATKRYATSARLFKLIATEMPKAKLLNAAFYEVVTLFKNDVLQSNMTYILSHPESVKLILENIQVLSGRERFFAKACAFVQLITHNATHQLDKVVRENPMMVRPYFAFVGDKSVEGEAKETIFRIITDTFEYCKQSLEQIYAQTVVCQNVSVTSADQYCSALLLLLLKLWCDDSDIPPPFMQTKIATELATLFRAAQSLMDLRATLNTLTEVVQYVMPHKMQIFFQTLDNEKCIHIPWSFEPYDRAPLQGLFGVTMTICMGTKDKSQVLAVVDECKKYMEKSEFHAKIVSELQQVL